MSPFLEFINGHSFFFINHNNLACQKVDSSEDYLQIYVIGSPYKPHTVDALLRRISSWICHSEPLSGGRLPSVSSQTVVEASGYPTFSFLWRIRGAARIMLTIFASISSSLFSWSSDTCFFSSLTVQNNFNLFIFAVFCWCWSLSLTKCANVDDVKVICLEIVTAVF